MTLRITTTKAAEAPGAASQDRAEVIDFGEGKVFVVADGAGGMSGGALAVDMIVEGARGKVREPVDLFDKDTWGAFLKQLDISLLNFPDAGQAAAVVAAVTPEHIVGASVGDCGALLITKGDRIDLTLKQHKKPFLGSGGAMPVSFESDAQEGRLLVATDGLFRYASLEKIAALSREDTLEAAAKGLVDLVRLPSRRLQDDVALILCELRKDG